MFIPLFPDLPPLDLDEPRKRKTKKKQEKTYVCGRAKTRRDRQGICTCATWLELTFKLTFRSSKSQKMAATSIALLFYFYQDFSGWLFFSQSFSRLWGNKRKKNTRNDHSIGGCNFYVVRFVVTL